MPAEKALTTQIDRLENLIHDIRGMKVMLDRDLAAVYGVATPDLNKAVKRNRDASRQILRFSLPGKRLQT